MTDPEVQIIAWTRDGKPVVALSVADAATAVGLSRASLDKAQALGLIEYHKFNTKPIVLVKDLVPFVENLPVL